MTIEVHPFPAVLRELLGDAFAGLAPTGDGYRVTLRLDGATSGYDGHHAADAYGHALLHLLRSQRGRMNQP
jgi:hypothetical protein